jgi:alanyl-tRNA synthetase
MIEPQYKIIADHIRSSSFLILDGVTPGNEGRSYVLRRILRRSMLQIHKLGIKRPIMHHFVEILAQNMKAQYPELESKKQYIASIIEDEELKFCETLNKGLKILNEEIASSKCNIFSGVIAFKLYDTYGFPLDLTQDIVSEYNKKINIDEFNHEMSLQKNRAKRNMANINDNDLQKYFTNIEKKVGSTTFTGYDSNIEKSVILDIGLVNNLKYIILNKTPFYATSGGQRGDKGYICIESPEKINDNNKLCKVSEVLKFSNNLYVHIISNNCNNFKVGQEIFAVIDPINRQYLAQGHSATHLLHNALKIVIDNNIGQKGSAIESQYFTFDYNYNKALTNDQIYNIEDLVNSYIRQNHKVKTSIMDINKAINKGAIAMFDSQYESQVRVLEIGPSIELCGGTHVNSTGNIGIFKIISDTSIASGIRRITAKIGYNAFKYLRSQDIKAQSFEKSLNIESINDKALQEQNSSKSGYIENIAIHSNYINNHDFEKNLEQIYLQKGRSLIKIIKDQEKVINSLKQEIYISEILSQDLKTISNINLLIYKFDNIEAKDIRNISNKVAINKKFTKSAIIILYSIYNDKITISVRISDDLTSKIRANDIFNIISQDINAKGGGAEINFAMGGGNNSKGINQALNKLINYLKNVS